MDEGKPIFLGAGDHSFGGLVSLFSSRKTSHRRSLKFPSLRNVDSAIRALGLSRISTAHHHERDSTILKS